MIDEWDLSATNLGRARERHYEVAVLPTAAIEPHNLHLPQGQDLHHTTWLARTCCREAFKRTPTILCLPPLPYGVDCNLLAYPLAIHVSQAALDAMVREILASLRRHGIRKIVLLNGHGGNDFVPLVRQVQCDMDVFVFLCDWWKVGHDRYAEIFDLPDDHAGQMETSVALALYPELVEMGRLADGTPRPSRFEAVNRGWVRTSRDFSRSSDVCAAGVVGDASADRGRQYLDLVAGRVTDFLVDLAQADIDESFPQAGRPPQ